MPDGPGHSRPRRSSLPARLRRHAQSPDADSHLAVAATHEERPRLALEAAGMGVYVWDPAADRTDADDRLRAIVGLAADEDFSLVAGLARFIHPDDRPRYAAAVSALLDPAGRGHLAEEVRWFGSDGQERWLAFFGRAYFGDKGDGRAVRVIGAVHDVTERRAAEAASRASKARFRAVWEATSDAIALSDPDGIVRDANPAYAALYGYDLSELIGAPFSLIFPEAQRAGAEAHYRAVFADPDPPVRYAARVRRRDGTERDVEARADFVVADGKRVALVSTVRDVTDRTTAEAAVRTSEARYRALVDGLPILVYERPFGDVPRPSYVNTRLTPLLGYAPDEWTPTLLERIHPDDRAGVLAESERVEGTHAPFRADYRERAKDGSWVWIRDEAVLIRDDAGAADHWLGVKLDVTDQKRAENALRAQAGALTGIVAMQADVAAVGPDPVAVMRLVADRAMALTGADGATVALVDGAEAVFRVAAGFLTPAEGTRVLLSDSLTGACLRTGELQHTDDAVADERGDRRTSSTFRVRAKVIAPLRHDGRVVGALSIAATEPGVFGDRERYALRLLAELVGAALAQVEVFAAMREARDTAEAASRLKSAFLSTMSHELRTPLNAIIGYADLVLDPLGAALTSTQRMDVQQIAAGGDRLLGLVNDVLDLARIEAGELDLEPQAVALAPLLAAVLAEVAPLAVAKRIALVALPLPPLPDLRADPHRLHQILVNLVGNAIKFTERGTIGVMARVVGNRVEIAVRDTGIGIAPDVLPHVFDEFRQADGGTTRRYGGSGLGLAIAKRLADLHGGTIVVESTPGAGSTFTLLLPLART